MEECKKRVNPGNKVSKIANIFQGMPSRDEDDLRGTEVSVVRTESHLARFNNARALFEKLGEENKGFHRIEKSPSAAASFAGTRTVQPVVPSRSRSSSAGSVSPPRRHTVPSVSVHTVNGDRHALNGAVQPPPKPIKPSVLPKPEKPDRRFNKELIEKQRNWTSHFNKSKAPRNEYDARVESKYPGGYNERKSPEVPERTVMPSRVYSPPLSPDYSHFVERPTNLPSSLIGEEVSTKASPAKHVHTTSPSKRYGSLSPTKKPEVATFKGNDELDSPTKVILDATYHARGVDVHEIRSSMSPQNDSDGNIYESPSRQLTTPEEKSDEIVTSTPHPKAAERSPSILEISPNLVTSSSESPVRSPISPGVQSPSPTIRSPRSPLPPLPQQDFGSNSIPLDHASPFSGAQNNEYDDYEPIEYANSWADKKNEREEKGRSSTPESPIVPATETSGVARSPLTSPLASPVPRSCLASPPPDQSSPAGGGRKSSSAEDSSRRAGSRASTGSDEGGFNEPSPEVVARLRPAEYREDEPPQPPLARARSDPDTLSVLQQDSGVVVSEASLGSIEVLDKSTTSQWSVSDAENLYEVTTAQTEDEAGKQPDSMTPDEAEILLSSR